MFIDTPEPVVAAGHPAAREQSRGRAREEILSEVLASLSVNPSLVIVRRPTSGTVAERIIPEVGLEDRFQHELGGRLNHAVHGWSECRAHAAIAGGAGIEMSSHLYPEFSAHSPAR